MEWLRAPVNVALKLGQSIIPILAKVPGLEWLNNLRLQTWPDWINQTNKNCPP